MVRDLADGSVDCVITDPVWPNVPEGMFEGWEDPAGLLRTVLYGEIHNWLDSRGTDPVDALATLNLYAGDHVHRIGNLTLTTGPLNMSMGYDPWEEKRSQLRKHSIVPLNRLLLVEDEWNEEEIVKRGKWLAEQVAACWPGPTSAAWEWDRDA